MRKERSMRNARDTRFVRLKLEDCVHNPYILDDYLVEKARWHNCYKTYSTLERIQSWKDSDCFYLDDGRRWNDRHDREMFNNEKSKVKRFGRCFSFSVNESVAMWMLYGGMNKNGAMLEFKRSAMRELIENTNVVELGNWENGEFKVVRKLNEGQFDLELKDIIYRDEISKSERDVDDFGVYYIRRSDEVCKRAPGYAINALDHCVKAAAWSYENECRLILSVNKAAVPEAIHASSVRIPLHNMLSGTNNKNTDKDKVKIYCSPNFAGEKPYLESALAGGIDWDLCAGCK